jgi:carbon storage regulator CsrA
MIGRDIEIIVLGISGSRVKLGIKAAENVSAWRKELARGASRPSLRKPR